MQRILVLRGGALGDFLVTLPALALLRQRWPEARIELVGNATAAELARNRGIIDQVHSQHEARWAALYGEAPLPATLAAWLGEFDLVVNYWPDPDGELRRRFPVRGGQVFLSAEAVPTRAPAAAHYCEPLRKLGLEPREYLYPLRPVVLHGSARMVPPLPRRATLIHPGSGSPKKNWPRENWLRLIEQLPDPVSLILGEAEAETWRDAAVTGLRPQVERLECRPLEELVAHLSGCRLFLGHDSGISHLAAACRVPCVLLFGATAPDVWAPPAATVRVMRRGPELASISPEDVQRELATVLADQR